MTLIFVKARLPRCGIAQRIHPKPEANVPGPPKNRLNFKSTKAEYFFVRLNDSCYLENVTVTINQRDISILRAEANYHSIWVQSSPCHAYPKWVNRRRERAHCQGQ